MSTSNHNNSQKANTNKKHSKVKIHNLKLHKTIIKNNPINNQERCQTTGSDTRSVTTTHGYLCSNQKWSNKIYRNSWQPIAICNKQINNQYQSKRLKNKIQSTLITPVICCFFFTFSMEHIEQYSKLFLKFSNKDKTFVSTLLNKIIHWLFYILKNYVVSRKKSWCGTILKKQIIHKKLLCSLDTLQRFVGNV